MEAEFDANALVQGSETVALEDTQWSLDEQACENNRIADLPSIIAKQIMRQRPTVHQVMTMALFAQAIQRKNEERQELVGTIVAQCS